MRRPRERPSRGDSQPIKPHHLNVLLAGDVKQEDLSARTAFRRMKNALPGRPRGTQLTSRACQDRGRRDPAQRQLHTTATATKRPRLTEGGARFWLRVMNEPGNRRPPGHRLRRRRRPQRLARCDRRASPRPDPAPAAPSSRLDHLAQQIAAVKAPHRLFENPPTRGLRHDPSGEPFFSPGVKGFIFEGTAVGDGAP